ncbi:MAG: DNA topoisomerase III [Proteobacteria bacterium]|nr:MAG: DNA topoisomerase III [Pseudomonadota bacterium]
MSVVIIAEKPDVAKVIAEGMAKLHGLTFAKKDGYLEAPGYQITHALGHLLRLKMPHEYTGSEHLQKWRYDDLPMRNILAGDLTPIERSEKQLNVVLKLVNTATEVIHACDPDSEGQLICDRIIQYSKYKGPVKRLLINDNNIRIVIRALENMKDNAEPMFAGLSRSAEARSIADQFMGLNYTRLYTLAAADKGHTGPWNWGRVNTAILGLIVKRYLQNKDHVSKPFWTIHSLIESNEPFFARLTAVDPRYLDSELRVIDQSFADKVVKDCLNVSGTIVSVETKDVVTEPSLPFNLIKLQVELSRRANIDPDETLSITQTLRERWKLITYNRSDCRYLSDEQFQDAPLVLDAIKLNFPNVNMLQATDHTIKSKAFDSKNVSAHHGIIPTEAVVDMSELNEKQLMVYKVICERYAMQFLKPSVSSRTSLKMQVAEHIFCATSSIVKELGFKAFLGTESTAEDVENNNALSEQEQTKVDLSVYQPNQKIKCKDVQVKSGMTPPPQLYTYASLFNDLTNLAKYVTDPKIKALLIDKDKGKKGENGGIGTPATRSTIVATQISNGFISKVKANIVPTEKALEYFKVLPAVDTSPDMTALWHQKQKEIEQGVRSTKSFLEELDSEASSHIAIVRRDGINLSPATTATCEVCKTGHVRQVRSKPQLTPTGRKSKKTSSFFWSCSNYKACNAKYEDKKGKPVLIKSKSASSSKEICGECGRELIPREGKYGRFWGCSGYLQEPQCKKIYKDVGGKPQLK